MSSIYHPQIDGQTEVVDKCLETYLYCFVIDKQNKWSQWLHLAKWSYNTTYHPSTKMTPFQALYGYEPPRWKDFALHNSKLQAIKNHLEENQRIINLLKENLTMARNRMKQQIDQHCTKREFKEGDRVFIRIQPYKQSSLKQQRKNKLSPKYYGPYQIIKKISSVAYGLKIPDHCRIHNTFHVSSLKKALGQNQTAQTEIPKTDEEGRIILEPEGILTTREKVLRSKTIKEYIIKWKRLLEEDSLWEIEHFRQQHPTLPML